MKLILGKSPEEQAAEEEQRRIEQEKEIQAKNEARALNMARMQKAIKSKQRAVIALVIVLVGSLVTFGTYNTFFKKTLDTSDVKTVIKSTVATFPTSGLDGYVRENVATWMKDDITYDTSSTAIESVTPVLDSLSIDNVVQVNSVFAKTYFSVDVETKHKDVKDSSGNITTKGTTDTKRYSFFIPIEYYHNYASDGSISTSGFRPLGKMTLYTLNSIDTTTINEENVLLKFTSDKEDDTTSNSAKTKVDKTLGDLYAGRDTSQDFINALSFDNYGATYNSITSFDLYKEANKLGYNAKVTYTVTTKEGFKMSNTNYLTLKPIENTWQITAMM